MNTEQPSTVFLNGMGHVEITWNSDNDAAMRALIEKKMAAGVNFFILKPRVFGLLGTRAEPVHNLNNIAHTIAVDDDDLPKLGVKAEQFKVKDADLAELAAAGHVQFRRRGDTENEVLRVARTVEEVITNRTVAAPRLAGG